MNKVIFFLVFSFALVVNSYAQKKPFNINSISFPLYGGTAYLDPNSAWDSIPDVIQQLKVVGANDVKVTVSANRYLRHTDNLPVAGINSFNPSDEKIVTFLKQLKIAGFQTTLNPFVNIDFDPNGNLLDSVHSHPTDFNLWIVHHKSAMLHYARLAEEANVDRFVIFGDEVQPTTFSPENTAGWTDLIAGVRSVYSGILTTVAYSDGTIFDGGQSHISLTSPQIWAALDLIGIGWFPMPLTNTKNPSLSQLISGWKNNAKGVDMVSFFNGIHDRYNKPIWISDIALHSFDGDNIDSGDVYNMAVQLVADQQEQADEYDSLFSVLAQLPSSWFLGVSADSWNRFPTNYSGHPRYAHSAYGENFKGKLAENVITKWYNGQRGWGGMEASPTVNGTASNLNLAVTINASTIDVGLDGNLFVAAFLPSGEIYLLGSNTNQWVKYLGSDIQSYGRVILGTHTIQVANGTLDVSSLIGTKIVAGYGLDRSDLINNVKYLEVYTVR
jgi:hypothetical protein